MISPTHADKTYGCTTVSSEHFIFISFSMKVLVLNLDLVTASPD